ncbi:MAG: divergent polysaccharide deacetylase family protein [Deltaproteobacteria bacterium]|nr:divergent polysaccharide deacetylase family protein [Deltaproteobacteria bacterium]
MAKKQSKPKKKSAPRAKSTKKKAPPQNRQPTLLFVILILLVGVVAGSGLFLLKSRLIHKAPVPVKPATIEKFSRPDFEIYPARVIPKKPLAAPALAPGKRPMVAIIIDDMGYEQKLCEKFIRLAAPITCSILPGSPHRLEIAQYAHKKGKCVMLHLPMEPVQYPAVNPGPGALLSSMGPDTLIRILKQDINSVPYISGVNNHMGSRLTADSDKMNQVLSILKTRRLFFIDSRTTAKTVARSSARLFALPFAERDVFLDNNPSEKKIRKQIKKLILIAEKTGVAIGIGHPHESTCKAIAAMIPEMEKRVRLVPASRLVSIPPL